MSTTRIDAWVYWCVAHGCSGTHETQCVYANFVAPFRPCLMVRRVVVDPDNLPPEAIQRAAKAMYEALGLDPDDDPWESVLIYQKQLAADMRAAAAQTITAFLSDPEPGDQT